jgi:hypothetical protein
MYVIKKQSLCLPFQLLKYTDSNGTVGYHNVVLFYFFCNYQEGHTVA